MKNLKQKNKQKTNKNPAYHFLLKPLFHLYLLFLLVTHKVNVPWNYLCHSLNLPITLSSFIYLFLSICLFVHLQVFSAL